MIERTKRGKRSKPIRPRKRLSMRSVKINVPYVAVSISHNDLSNGTLTGFNAHINSMIAGCVCTAANQCYNPGEGVNYSPATKADDEYLIIFIKQTAAEKIYQDNKVLNVVSSAPNIMVGHCVVKISSRLVWDKDLEMKSQKNFLSILSLCKHKGQGISSKVGYERVMLNAFLRWADRLCDEHYQWIAVDHRREDFGATIKLLTDYGFGTPYVVQESLHGEFYTNLMIALFKKNTHMGTNDTENRLNYTKAVELARRVQRASDKFLVSFDERTINNLRLMPFFVTGSGTNNGSAYCLPTTPLNPSELTTIVEYGGKFNIEDVDISETNPVFKLFMERPPEGFYSFNVGEPESIREVPAGSFNFHTHPYATYFTRFMAGNMFSIPTLKNPTPYVIKHKTKIIIGPPSSGDFAYIYYHSVVNRKNPIQIHYVVAVEGIWTISVNKHAARPAAPITNIAELYNINLSNNDLKSLWVDPEEPLWGYSGEGVEEGRVEAAVQAYIDFIRDLNALHGDIFTVQFYSWKNLSAGVPIVHDERSVGMARLSYQYDGNRNLILLGVPLITLEDFREVARIYPGIDPEDPYSW